MIDDVRSIVKHLSTILIVELTDYFSNVSKWNFQNVYILIALLIFRALPLQNFSDHGS